MKLKLTIEDHQHPTTKETLKLVFGTLSLQKHKDKFEEEVEEYNRINKLYLEDIEKNPDSNMIQPVYPKQESINFTLDLSTVPGFEDIVNQIVMDASNLQRQEEFRAMREKVASRNFEAKQNQTFGRRFKNKIKDFIAPKPIEPSKIIDLDQEDISTTEDHGNTK